MHNVSRNIDPGQLVTGTTSLDMKKMRRSAGDVATILRSMANEDRLMLLCQLAHGECCVSELEALLDIQQPTLSQQLGVLRNEELVTTRRAGKHVYYRIRDNRVISLLETLYENFCERGRKSS
jgi:DNA-binding transcriptional ArsR family regulator